MQGKGDVLQTLELAKHALDAIDKLYTQDCDSIMIIKKTNQFLKLIRRAELELLSEELSEIGTDYDYLDAATRNRFLAAAKAALSLI
jgi:hypothetical protein